MSLLHYGADMFTDSGRNSGTARRKAKFVNLMLDFIADGCPRDRFAVKIVANLASAQIALHWVR